MNAGGHRGATTRSLLRPHALLFAFLLFAATACASIDDYTAGSANAPIESGEEPSAPDDDTADTDDPGETDDAGDSGDGGTDEAEADDPAPEDPPVDEEPAPDEPPPDEEPPADEPVDVPVSEPVVVNTFPHDTAAFTQGLELIDGVLLESVGLRGESGRRRVVPTTGEVSASVPLDPALFGAGITVVDNTIYQLTWQAGVLVLADLTTLQELDRQTYDGEGWGLCNVGDGRLAMSDGSDRITFRDVATFAPTDTVSVTLNGRPLDRINELECVNGRIWANVWLTSDIVQIDPASGAVLQRIDASSLIPAGVTTDDVLNGIAFNPAAGTFYVTGKRWPVLYELDLGPT